MNTTGNATSLDTLYLPIVRLRDYLTGKVTEDIAFSLTHSFESEVAAVEYFAARYDFYSNTYGEAGIELLTLIVRRYNVAPLESL